LFRLDPKSLPLIFHKIHETLSRLCSRERRQFRTSFGKENLSNRQLMLFLALWELNPNRVSEVVDETFLADTSSIIVSNGELN